MKLLNIANQGRTIFMFCREDDGKLRVFKDDTFNPFFFEPDSQGEYTAIDGTKLKKILVDNPQNIIKMRSEFSYSSDIRYTILYLTHKIQKIEYAPIKYLFIDIEILTKDLPSVSEAPAPVSCITIYNSLSKKYTQFYLDDYEGTLKQKEARLCGDFVDYIQKEKPDIWFSWNVGFDYDYMYNRFGREKFAKLLSPIGSVRLGKSEGDIWHPDGLSVCDYLQMFKKVNWKENSYKLDDVCEKHLKQGKKHKEVRFDVLSQELKERNLEDVELLVKLEEKFRIVDYFNEIRIFSKSRWEDLTHNSMILDSIILEEARQKNIILPNKKKKDEEAEELQGAYRRSESGLFYNLYKADVGSMYPNQIANFCLDPANIQNPISGPSKDFIEVNGTYFKQDQNALFPFISKKLMTIKQDLKDKLKAAKEGTEDKKLLQMKYDAYKGLVNSLYGVAAFPTFRLYNYTVASAITFLSRDLLQYVEEQMKARGFDVTYTDTDALLYKADKDETELLNKLTQEWAKDKYGKSSIDIEFENEGKFTKLLVLGKCHYYGYIDTGKGIKKEIKGVEIKRSSSSKYEAYFQEQLIEKVLDNRGQKEIVDWVSKEKQRIKTLPILEIGFPCKVANKEYENDPVFVRAVRNTKNIIADFNVNKGENFYYIYVTTLGKDNNGKDINVIAFTKENYDWIDKKRIDWDKIIKRNIDDKSNKIFEAIGWEVNLKNPPVATLF